MKVLRIIPTLDSLGWPALQVLIEQQTDLLISKKYARLLTPTQLGRLIANSVRLELLKGTEQWLTVKERLGL